MSLTTEQRRGLRRSFPQWKGTRYLPGQCLPGQGVDCVRLVDACLQRVYDLKLEPLPRHAQDAAYHSREVVQLMTRALMERFSMFVLRPPMVFEPADLLILRQRTEMESKNPGPHHIAIVGLDRIICMDAWPNVGVRFMGIGGIEAAFEILKVFRSEIGYEKPATQK